MDIALKQRLVGASVLVALAVIVLPMLLGGRPDGEVRETQKIQLPAQPSELDFETRRYPIGQTDVQREERPAVSPPVELPAPATRATPEPKPEFESAPPAIEQGVTAGSENPVLPPAGIPAETGPDGSSEPAIARQEPVVDASTPGSGRYLVQVASFGSMQNASRLSDRLDGYGYSVMLDTIKSDVGTLHRVRVGPFASESEAAAVAGRIQDQVEGIKPRVMDTQPDRTAQVTQPSDPLVRWVVQVGSFSSDSNADKLVARLRLESLTAYKEQVNNASGSTTYRVRVGPFLEREEAIRIDRIINERLSIDGVVMSAD
jgi:cell division septation protein DedD